MQLQCYDDAISWCEKGLAVSFITPCTYVLFQLCRNSSESSSGINYEKLCSLPLLPLNIHEKPFTIRKTLSVRKK